MYNILFLGVFASLTSLTFGYYIENEVADKVGSSNLEYLSELLRFGQIFAGILLALGMALTQSIFKLVVVPLYKGVQELAFGQFLISVTLVYGVLNPDVFIDPSKIKILCALFAIAWIIRISLKVQVYLSDQEKFTSTSISFMRQHSFVRSSFACSRIRGSKRLPHSKILSTLKSEPIFYGT